MDGVCVEDLDVLARNALKELDAVRRVEVDRLDRKHVPRALRRPHEREGVAQGADS